MWKIQNTRLVKVANIFDRLSQEDAIKESITTLLMGFTEAEIVKLFSSAYLTLHESYFNEWDTYVERKGLYSK